MVLSKFHLGTFYCLLIFSFLAIRRAEAQNADSAAAVRKYCLAALPADGHARITLPDGKLKIVPCTDLLGKDLQTINALRAERDEQYLQALKRKLVRNPADLPDKYWRIVSGNQEITGKPLHPEERLFLEAEAHCWKEQRLFPILTRIAHLPIVLDSLSYYFEFHLTEDDDDIRFLRIAQRVVISPPDDRTIWTIYIPRELLWVDAVTDDLLIFMLLHEMGHAMQESDTELNADRWAVQIGMPAYYGDQRAAELRDEIATSFEAYCRAVYTADTYMNPSPTRCPNGCYPSLACRKMFISGSMESVEDSSYHQWDECWDQADGSIEGTKPSDQHWMVGNCCPTPVKEPVLTCVNTQLGKLCYTNMIPISTVEIVRPIIDRVFDLCSKHPDLCSGSAPNNSVGSREERKWLRAIKSSSSQARTFNNK